MSRRNRACRLVAATLAATLAFAPAQACTSFLLRTSDGGSVYGRTMEFGFQLDSKAVVIPRAHALAATGPDGKPGRAWTSTYAAVGLNAFGEPVLTDGMNEKGLAGGILYFPDYVGYTEAFTADPAKAMAPWDFLTYALTSFATVAEVKAAMDGVQIVGVAQPGLGFVPPFHYTLHDATGASIVVEPVDGILKVYDNPLGVMTNAPTFDWHMTNLKNYVKLSPFDAPPLELRGATVSSLGQGSGLLGMPGDATPPSRFIRALGYVMSVGEVPSGDASVRLAEHVLNNFDIPVGWIRGTPGQNDGPLEFTQWSTVADLSNHRYYVKTYEDQVLRGIDLMSFDLDATEIRYAPLLTTPAPPDLPFP